MTTRLIVVDHVLFVVEDLAACRRLYTASLAPVGFVELHVQDDGVSYGADDLDDFIIAQGSPVTSAAHVAFDAPGREAVDAFFEAAIANGATVRGEPGVWTQYSDRYYAAFVNDLHGNNVEAVWHAPEAVADAPQAGPLRMDIPFVLRGIQGNVSVAYGRNDRTDLVGSVPGASGFPICEATVDYPAEGYNAVLGWVQLVRSDDNANQGEAFEIDPLAFLGDVPHPFCWIGLSPRLFDAPWRSTRRDLDWTAHSFLCVPDGIAEAGLEVHALLGFAWGFRTHNEEVQLVPPTLLGPADWDRHVDDLGERYPSWRFILGFRED